MVPSQDDTNSDGNELAAITLLILQREHPCQKEADDDDFPTEEEDIAEIEGVLLDAAVDMVIALAKVLKDQFAPEFGPFYRRLIKSTVHLTGTV
jgi:importin-4